MSFLNKYNTYPKTLLNKKHLNKYNKKTINMQILIKLFDKPARKSLTLMSSLMILNEWSLCNISLVNKYKINPNGYFFTSLHNSALWVFL